MTDTTGRERVLNAARDAVMRDRNAEYAPPEQNFDRIANLWNTYLEGRRITSYDVAIMCGLIKVARAISSPGQIDHLIDLAGYAACAGDVIPEPGEPPAPIDEVIPEADHPAVTFEGEPGVLKVAYPEPGLSTFYADGGRKVELHAEAWTRAEQEGVLVYAH